MYLNDDERFDLPIRFPVGSGESAYSVTGVGSQRVTAPQHGSWSQHDTHVSLSLLRCAFTSNLPSSSKSLRLPNITPITSPHPYTRTHTPAKVYYYNTQTAQATACHQLIRNMICRWLMQTHPGNLSLLRLRRHSRSPTNFNADNALCCSMVTTEKTTSHDTYGINTRWPT